MSQRLQNSRRAVFLDRDGVINRALVRGGKPYPPRSAPELDILPGVPGALQSLRQAGFLLIVVSNQPDVARGLLTPSALDEIHERIRLEVPLDAIYACCHDDADGCECRKPKAGLLARAARELGVDTGASYMVGDRWRDIEAGHRAGCTTILVDYGYAEPLTVEPDHRVESLAEAAEWILSRRVL